MTTPGGVPNLPLGALTVGTLGKKLQDLTAPAVRKSAGERMPNPFGNSTGGNILNDLSPFGILTRIFAEFYALIAAAAPSDITGPEDLPGLITDFIEDLPFVGQLFDLLLAFLGQYEGDDVNLNAIQDLFAPLRALVDAFGALVDGELTNLIGFFDGFDIYDPINSGTRLLDQIVNYVIDQILTVLTGAGGGIGDFVEHIPVIGDIVRTLTGQTGDDNAAADLGALGNWARGLLTNITQIPAENLVGTLASAVLGIIPVGNIGNITPNLLTVNSFADAANFVPDDNWTWDNNTNHDGNTGSAKLVLDGTVLQLTSGQDIPISPGDKLDLSVWLKTSSFSGSGTPLSIQLVPFIGTAQQSAVTVASRAGSTSWVKLSGQYTVPTASSSADQITSIRVQLAASASATSGTVWWDDITLSKVGLLQQNLVDQLFDAWRNITGTVGGTLTTLLAALPNPLSVANTATQNLGTLNSTLQSTPGTILGTLGSGLSGALADGVKTVGQLLGGLFDAFSGGVSGVVKTVTQLLGVANYPLSQATVGITNAGIAQNTADFAQAVATGLMVSGSNLCPNPGFENTDFYIGTQGSYSTELVRNGIRSLKITAAGGYKEAYLVGNSSSALWIPCTPGDVFYMESWVRGNASNTATAGTVANQIIYKVGSTSSFTYAAKQAGSIVPASSWNNTWTKLSGYVTIPDNAFEFTPRVFVDSVASGNSYYFDDAVVREITYAYTAVKDTNTAIYNGYYGFGGSGVVAEAQQTIAAIKTKLDSGYTLQSLTYNSGSETQIVTVNGAPTGGTFTLSYSGQTTSSIAYNASASTVQTSLRSLSNIGSGNATVTGSTGGPYTVTLAPYVQIVTVSGSPTSGTFTLTYKGQTTSAIAYNASASTVQTALTALSTVGSGKATVTGSAGGPYTVKFDSSLSSIQLMTSTSSFSGGVDTTVGIAYSLFTATSSLTGGTSPSVSISPTWKRPWATDDAPKEFFVVAFGSGGGGGAGEANVYDDGAYITQGGHGGQPGGYAAVQVDAAALPATVAYKIAAGGLGRTSGSRNPTAGSESSFGSYLTTVSGLYNVTNLLGYYSTNSSAPGLGGTGGGSSSELSGTIPNGYGSSGLAGGSSPLAKGGAGGTGAGSAQYAVPGAGGTGGTASLTGTARAGGGGGGGGGGQRVSFDSKAYPATYPYSYAGANGYSDINPGGLGGNGGFPGAGAGGGGGCLTAYNSNWSGPPPAIPAGNGGNGANGVIILLWK